MRVESVNFSITSELSYLKAEKNNLGYQAQKTDRRTSSGPSKQGPILYDAQALVVISKKRGQIVDLYV